MEDFIEQLKNDFIPKIEEMLRKEVEHQNFLRRNIKQNDSPHFQFILDSKVMIACYTLRIQQYKDYVKLNSK